MRRLLLPILAIPGFLLFIPCPSQAIPIAVSWGASEFSPPNYTGVLPPISGTIVYDADSINSPVNSLISVDFTVLGHSFTLDEIGFLNDAQSMRIYIGGLINGVSGITSQTDDFYLTWNWETLAGPFLAFAGSDVVSIIEAADPEYKGGVLAYFTVTELPTSIPEPSTLLLLGFGLAGLGGMACRREDRG